MLDIIQNPFVLTGIILLLIGLIVIPVVIRRRRASQEEVLPPPELGESIDYTSIQYEEPTGPLDRFKRASLVTKILIILLPLLVLIGIGILIASVLRSGNQEPPTPLPTLTIEAADVVSKGRIVIEGRTSTKPDKAAFTVGLLEDNKPFDWFDPNAVETEISGNQFIFTLTRRENAPKPVEGRDYTAVLTVTMLDGRKGTSAPVELFIPQPNEDDFFQVVAPTPVPSPTEEPTNTAQPSTAEPTAVITPTAAPTVTPTSSLVATVFNGGNIRDTPNIRGKQIGTVHAGEVVDLLERSPNGEWYRIKAPEGTGWVSRTLLTVDPEIAKRVPVSGQTTPSGLTAKVFNGGNVRERAALNSRVLDQINAGETVQLLQKTANGEWYQITNIRNVTGWVSRTLLTIEPAVANQVPVAR